MSNEYKTAQGCTSCALQQFFSLQTNRTDWIDQQRKLFNRHIALVKAESLFFTEAPFLDPEIEFHDDAFDQRQGIVTGQEFFHDNELHIADRTYALQPFVLALHNDLPSSYHFLDYFLKHQVRSWRDPEAQAKL